MLISEPKVIRETFQEHVVRLLGADDKSEFTKDLTDVLADLSRILGWDAESCEGSITPEVLEVKTNRITDKALGFPTIRTG